MKIFALAAFLTVFSLSMDAQNVEMSYNYPEFRGVDAGGDFSLSFVNSDRYSVKLTVDNLLESYVQAFVRDGILYLAVDTRSFPPDLRKALKGRNAIVPVLEATIYAPCLKEVHIGDNVKVNSTAVFETPSVSVTMDGSASIISMPVKASAIHLSASKAASVKTHFAADSLSVSASGGAEIDITHEASHVNIYASGSSNVVADGGAEQLFLKSDATSKTELRGSAASLAVDATGNSRIEAKTLSVPEGNIVLSGSAKCHVNAHDTLKVDLTGYSSLVFDGDPEIEIVRIVSSSLTRTGDTETQEGE